MQGKRPQEPSIPSRVIRSVRNRGLRGSGAVAWHRFHERFTDWRLGIETYQGVDLTLGELCHDYEATDYRLLTKAFRLLRDVEQDVVFLDYGCGKGRTIAVAAMRPFKCVIGIDLHDGLLADASKNMARIQNRVRCQDVSVLNIDATQYEVPDDINAVFMFNPFRGEILQAVIAQINTSLRRNPRKLILFFLYPPEFTSDPFEQFDWCSRLTEISVGRHRELKFPVYETRFE